MADIDLKTETPDTSLPTTGFLFGADSQASASPSVYSIQTVATTLLGSTSLTGAIITTSQPVLDLEQTWNASGVTFTGLRFNAATGSNANSAAGSLLMDLQLEGASRFKIAKTGEVSVDLATATNGSFYAEAGSVSTPAYSFDNGSGEGRSSGIYYNHAGGAQEVIIARGGSAAVRVSSNIFSTGNAYQFGWSSSVATASMDTILTRRAAANLRLGTADAGATTTTVTITIAAPGVVTWFSHGFSTGTPVVFTTTGALPTGITAGTTYYAVVVDVNTFQIASSVANAIAATPTVITTSGTQSGTHTGTRYNITQRLGMQSNTGVTDRLGADLIIQGSQGTGTGAGGSIIFQVAPAGSSGTAQNALETLLTINPNRTVSIGGLTIDPSNGGTTFLQTFGITMQTSNAFIIRHGNNDAFNIRPVSSGTPTLGFIDTSNVPRAILYGEAANTLALRNANNGQTFRVYGRFTDITNDFERFFINAPTTSGAAVQLGTQKGATTGAARALEFQTDGTTRLTIETNGTVTHSYSDANAGFLVQNSNALGASSGGSVNIYTTLGPSAADQRLGQFLFGSTSGGTRNSAAVAAFSEASWTLGSSHPTYIAFATTASGSASRTERMRVTAGGDLQISDAGNIAVGTTTGTKIGTATTQKIGFFNKTPVVQPTAVADATDNATAITQLNALLSRMRDLGLIAT